jgi:hypothetical protein
MLPKRFMLNSDNKMKLPEDETIIANNTKTLKDHHNKVNANIDTISSNIPTNNTTISSFATNLVNRTLLQNANN